MTERIHQIMRISASCYLAILFAVANAALTPGAAAQTWYANTNELRPLNLEDAVAIERYALDLSLAPLSFAEARPGSIWSLHPGVTYGLLKRGQLDLAVPVTFDRDGEAAVAIDGSMLYALNVEAGGMPAFALRGKAVVPLAGATEAMLWSMKGVATRSFRWGRAHLNYEHAFGEAVTGSGLRVGAPSYRWSAGVALDRTLPLRGLLVGAEVFAARPLDEGSPAWTVGMGARYQLTSRVALDLGTSAGVTERAGDWRVSIGIGRTTAVRSILPGLGEWGD